MAYKIINGKLAAETDKNYLDVSSSKRELFDALSHQVQRAEAAEARAAQLETDNDEMQSYINEIRVALHTEKDELTIDAVRRVISERDELARKLELALNREQMDRAVMTEASRMIDELRQEARDSAGRVVTLMAELEQAQRRIEELETTLKDIATAPYENQPNDGDEWEKEYYLRVMHRT